MRPPVTPTIPAIPQQGSPPRQSPSAANGVVHDSTGDQDLRLATPTAVNGGSTDDPMGQIDGQAQAMMISSPVRPKSQTPTMTAIPNGFTIPSVNNYSSHLANGTAYSHHAGMRGNGIMKSALAATLAGQDGVNGGMVPMRQPASYLAHNVMSPSNYNVQLQAARQMQWAAIQQQQQQQQHRPPAINIVDGNGVDGTPASQLSPPLVPPRTPSANGNRPVSLSRGLSSPALAQAMAAGQGRASPGASHIGRMTPHPPHSPNMLAAQPHGSPPRPQPPIPSPSLQARQVVGGSGVGY